jgi:hypothetical protein
MLKNLGTPGTSLSDLMTNVIADVKSTTGGKQVPRVDLGLSKPFYFIDPAVAAAQAALDKSKAELAGLDSKLANLQKQIASASEAQAKQKLQVEQQRQQALQQAKALEADNLAKEAAKQKAVADAAVQLASERAAAQAANAKAQNDLSNLASARRAELDKLAQAAASDNPDVLIDTVERLEAVLKEVDGQYAAALQRSLAASTAGWDKYLAVVKGEKPDITESDAEFAVRQNQEKSDLEAKRKNELADLRSNIEAQRTSQTAAMRKQYEDTLRTLQTKVWSVAGSGAKLSIGAFDRNARTWPFTVDSADPAIPMVPVNLVAQLGSVADPVAAIRALDAAVKAKALAAEFDWGITRDDPNNRYAIDVKVVRVRNLTSNEVVAQARPNQRAAYFVPGKRSSPTEAVGTLTVTTRALDGSADVYINGVKVGVTPYTAKVPEGSFKVEGRWTDSYVRGTTKNLQVVSGSSNTVSVVKEAFKLGGSGPAVGIIFYDKGSPNDGWRYLEAAPSDQSTGIQWWNGSHIDIKTGTAVGTGRANTDAIIAAQESGSYAATICKNLSIGGFSDWFLPSKDKLGLMYWNLKKSGLGAFGEGWFWSSSQGRGDDYGNAWGQRFSDGSQGSSNEGNRCAFHACRAF